MKKNNYNQTIRPGYWIDCKKHLAAYKPGVKSERSTIQTIVEDYLWAIGCEEYTVNTVIRKASEAYTQGLFKED